jgi:hypothetical protein
VWKGLL